MEWDLLLDTIEVLGTHRQAQPAVTVPHNFDLDKPPRAVRITRCGRISEVLPGLTTRSVADNQHHPDDFVLVAEEVAAGLTWGDILVATGHFDKQEGKKPASVVYLPAEGTVEIMSVYELESVRYLFGDDSPPSGRRRAARPGGPRADDRLQPARRGGQHVVRVGRGRVRREPDRQGLRVKWGGHLGRGRIRLPRPTQETDMAEMKPRSGQSIPGDVLRRICEHRPELRGYAESMAGRPDAAQMVEKQIAEQYLAGESRLSEHETACLERCRLGEAYGDNAGHELMAEDTADRGSGRRDGGASERMEA